MILDRPNCFGQVQIDLVMSKPFWSGPNHFGQVRIRLFWTIFYNLELSKMIWTRPKQIGPVQNDWYSTKMIWSVQNHFGPIEGQGISLLICTYGPYRIQTATFNMWYTEDYVSIVKIMSLSQVHSFLKQFLHVLCCTFSKSFS